MCKRLEEEEEKLSKNPNNKSQQDYVEYFRRYVRGSYYRGDEEKELVNWKSVYRVSTDKHWYYYIGHYDSTKFQQEMVDYKNGHREVKAEWEKVVQTPT